MARTFSKKSVRETKIKDVAGNEPSKQTPAPQKANPVQENPVFRYRRRQGSRPYKDRSGKIYNPGDILESDHPNAIPFAFMDNWEVLEDPTEKIQTQAKLPVLEPTEGGFNVLTFDGRKLNDRPLTAKQAQELIDGLNPKTVE